MSSSITNPVYDRIISLHAWRDNNVRLLFTQGEGVTSADADEVVSKIKVPRFKLIDSGGAINLTGCDVYFALTRPDGSEDLLACNVDSSPSSGIVYCPITASATEIAGAATGEIRVLPQNQTSTTKFFGIHVIIQKGVSDNVIERSEQFSALINALQRVATVEPDGSNTVLMDTEIQQNGTNPVASGVLYNAFRSVYNAINSLDSETIIRTIADYLENHPELITAVDDGELSISKLQKGTLGFVTPDMFINDVQNPNSDTQLIQAAIDYAAVNDVFVFLPAKTYLIGGLIINKPVKIVGAGQNKTILKESANETNTSEELDGNNDTVTYVNQSDFIEALLVVDISNMSGESKNYCTISDLSFEGDRVSQNTDTIPPQTQLVPIEYCVKNETTDEMTDETTVEYIYKEKNGISLRAAERVVINNVSIHWAGCHGVRLTTDSRDCKLSNITVRASAQHGIRQEGYGSSMVNVETSQNIGDGISITNGGCQISNAKSWGNRGNGVCLSGASYCMISNVNSQQNRCCGLKITNGYRNGATVIPTYNVITAFQSVGNNFSANSNNNTVNILDNQPQKQYANSSGFYISGRDNIIQGVDIRANWTGNWYAVEKCAVYVTQDSVNNKIDVVCSEGETSLFNIYDDPMFSTIGFDTSTMLIVLNDNNHININGANNENINQNIYSKLEINEIFGITNTTLLFEEDKYLITNVSDGAKINLSAFVANEGYHVSKTAVTAGEKFIINAYGGNQALAWAFFESDGTKIQGSDSAAIVTNLLLTAPANAAYLVVNNQKEKNINNACYQIKEMKTTTVNSSSTHSTIPTTKAVYDAIQTAIGGVENGSY